MSEGVKRPLLRSDSISLDVDNLLKQLLSVRGRGPSAQVKLPEDDIRSLCLVARDVLLNQPCLLELATPMKICGDIHGQYHDLLRLFDYGGHPPESNYLFLGDYVDRGKRSLETICLLLCYKVKYPNNFFLLRGNHESASINKMYGFYDECKRRYSSKLWRTFTDCFNCLPIAATVDGKIFCAHGGLSPELFDLEQINRVSRPTDVPDTGLLCDLLWSDPDRDIIGWGENDRGVSFTFGEDIAKDFLAAHDLDLICRAHQVVEDGYEFFAKRRLVTIFSAPNYCGEFDNAGAMMSVDEGLMCSFQILQSSEKKQRFQRKPSGANRGWPKKGLGGGARSSGGDPRSPVGDPLLALPEHAPRQGLEHKEDGGQRDRQEEEEMVVAQVQPRLSSAETSVPPPPTSVAAAAAAAAAPSRNGGSSGLARADKPILASSAPAIVAVPAPGKIASRNLPTAAATTPLSREASLNSSGSDESGPAAFGSLPGDHNRINPGSGGSASGGSSSSSSGKKRAPPPPLPTASRASSTTAAAAAAPRSANGPPAGTGSDVFVVSLNSCAAGVSPRALQSLVAEGVVEEGRIGGAGPGSLEKGVGVGVPAARAPPPPPPPATPLSEAIATKGLADIDGVGRSAEVWGDDDDWTNPAAGVGYGGSGGGGGRDDKARRRHWLNTAASRRGDRRFASASAKEGREGCSETLSNGGGQSNSNSRSPSPAAVGGGAASSPSASGVGSIGGMGMAVAGRGLGHAGQAVDGGRATPRQRATATATAAAAAGSKLAQIGGGQRVPSSPLTHPLNFFAPAPATAGGTAVGAAAGFSNMVPVPSSSSNDGGGSGGSGGGGSSGARSQGNEPGTVDSSKEGVSNGKDVGAFAKDYVGTLSSDEGSTPSRGGTPEGSASPPSDQERAPDADHRLLSGGGGDLDGVGWRDTPSYGEALYMGNDESVSGRGWGGVDRYDPDRELLERRMVVQERQRSEMAADGVSSSGERRALRGEQRRVNARARESATATAAPASGSKSSTTGGVSVIDPAMFPLVAFGLATPPGRFASTDSADAGSGSSSSAGVGDGGAAAGGGADSDGSGWATRSPSDISDDRGGDRAGGKSPQGPVAVGGPARPPDSMAELFATHQIQVRRLSGVSTDGGGGQRGGGVRNRSGGGVGDVGSPRPTGPVSLAAATADADAHRSWSGSTNGGGDSGFGGAPRSHLPAAPTAHKLSSYPGGSSSGGEDTQQRGEGGGPRRLVGRKLAKWRSNLPGVSKRGGSATGGDNDYKMEGLAGDLDSSNRSSVYSECNSSARSDSIRSITSASDLVESVKKGAGIMWDKVSFDHPDPLPVDRSLSKAEWKAKHYQMEVSSRNDWQTNSIGEQHVLQHVLKQPEEKVWN